MKPHVCPLCHGEGRVLDLATSQGTVKTCRPCEGRGIVWEQDSVVHPPSTPAEIFSTAKTMAERIVAADQASRGTIEEDS